jgi:hypothetical protein
MSRSYISSPPQAPPWRVEGVLYLPPLKLPLATPNPTILSVYFIVSYNLVSRMQHKAKKKICKPTYLLSLKKKSEAYEITMLPVRLCLSH